MLRKTTAIAVLVLMIASLFTGSLGNVQAVVPANTEAAYYMQSEHTLQSEPALQTGRNLQWDQYAPFRADKMVLPGGPVTAGFFVASDHGSLEFTGVPAVSSGIVVSHVAIPDLVSVNTSGQAVSESGTVVIYMNDSKIEVTGAGWAKFMEDHAAKGMMFMPPDPLSREMFIHGKVAMFRPGSASPDMYDMRWERTHTDRPELFSAHLVIPMANGSNVNGSSLWPDAGVLELNSDITLDLANLSFNDNGTYDSQAVDDSQAVVDSLYNNEISAGETKWHSADISAAVESINVDLKWQDSDSNLQLIIYTPDGHTLGPYDDSADGKDDSRINLNVANPSGVASGEWYLKVTDADASGQDAYYVKTY